MTEGEAELIAARPSPEFMKRAGDLLEALAELEHIQWRYWAMAVEDEVSAARRERWRECYVPYGRLGEELKEMDRIWAMRALALVERWLAEKEGASR